MSRTESRAEENSSAGLGSGNYRLMAEIGQGGMATVYLAVVLGSGGFRKLAVVKVLRPEFGVDAEFIQMFLDEARLSARLNHPNIVQTYDVWETDGQHMMAMEYLDGVSLHLAAARLAKAGTPMKFAFHATILLEVLEGLRYAHELCDYDGQPLRIVHRDVTPHNIFVTYDGQAKLLDFGIAKAATSSVRTATGVIKGKITYMSPEQAVGDPVDVRTDLFAVGVMLWEAITGRRRWPAGISEPALFTKLVTGELPDPPGAAARGYPAELDDIVMRAVAPKREDRFASAVEFRDALQSAIQPLGSVLLRDLGAILGTTFEPERQRLRAVIEEQFRLIKSGRPAPDRRALPLVAHRSPTHTLSESNKWPVSHPQEVRTAEAARPPSMSPETRAMDRRIARISRHVPAMRSKVAMIGVAVGAAGLLLVAGAIFSPHTSSHPTSEPGIAVGNPVDGAAALRLSAIDVDASGIASHVSDPAQSDPSPTPVQVDAAARFVKTAKTGDGRNAVSSIVGVPSAAPVRTAVPASSAVAAPEPTLPRKESKPRVQLERDNPWP